MPIASPIMVTAEEMNGLIDRLTENLNQRSHDAAVSFPFEAYGTYLRSAFSHLGVARNHSWLAWRRRRWYRKIVSTQDPTCLRLCNRLVLVRFMRESMDRLPGLRLPEETLPLIHAWFDRMTRDCDRQPESYYDPSREAYRIDLGVCCLQSIPVGGAWIVQKSRMGLGPLISGSPGQLFRYLWFVWIRTGGFTPFYVLHTVPRYLPQFRQKEMDHAYMRIAALLKWDRSVRGLYRGGWLLDPNLERISPELSFLRTLPQHNGARLFRSVTTKADVQWALSLSSARRRQFEAGRYQPASHAYVWPRNDLLDWAAAQESGEGSVPIDGQVSECGGEEV